MKARRRIQVGDRFTRLVVIKDLGMHLYGGKAVRKLQCGCDCGNTRIAWAGHLRDGSTKSCGCLCVGRGSNVLPVEAATRVVIQTYKANAKNRKIAFGLTDAMIRRLLVQDCAYCGIEPSTRSTSRAGCGEFYYNGIASRENVCRIVAG